MNDVHLRSIDRGDVRELARLHKDAFPGFFLSRLGEPFLVQFYAGFLGDPSSVTVVAHTNVGTLLGAVVGTSEPVGFFSRLVRQKAFGFAVASLRALARQPAAAIRLARALTYRGDGKDRSDGALLSSIFVDPHLQSSGVGSLLMRAWEVAAAEHGARTAFLTTDAADNDSVNTFYARRGWLLVETYVTREGRAMNRYTKRLDAS